MMRAMKRVSGISAFAKAESHLVQRTTSGAIGMLRHVLRLSPHCVARSPMVIAHSSRAIQVASSLWHVCLPRSRGLELRGRMLSGDVLVSAPCLLLSGRLPLDGSPPTSQYHI